MAGAVWIGAVAILAFTLAHWFWQWFAPQPAPIPKAAPQSDLAEKLAQITPGRLKKSFFTNSGTEADDTAVHAAKLATGRHEIVVLRHAYSGRSATSLSAMGHSTWRPLPPQVSGFVHAQAPYCYRCPFKLTYPECGLACANDIEELIMTTTTGEIAAFMAEPILGVGGFIVPPAGYFERAVEITRKHGGLFIADAVIFWSLQHDHVGTSLIAMTAIGFAFIGLYAATSLRKARRDARREEEPPQAAEIPESGMTVPTDGQLEEPGEEPPAHLPTPPKWTHR